MEFKERLKYLLFPNHDREIRSIIRKRYEDQQLRNHVVRIILYVSAALGDYLFGEIEFNSLSDDMRTSVGIITVLIFSFMFVMLFRMWRKTNYWWEPYTLFIVDVLFLLYLHWFYVNAEIYPEGKTGEYVLVVCFIFAFLNFVNIFKIDVLYMLFGSVFSTIAAVTAALLTGQEFYATLYFYSAFIVFFMGLLGVFITYLLRENIVVTRKLEAAARTDPLTGLSNRRDMLEKINAEIHRSRRSKKPFSLILFDIDHFKAFNDNFGHDCGDHVLISVARVQENCLRKQDVVSRWGGEEFLVLLPETGKSGAQTVGEKLRLSICENKVEFNGKLHTVTVTGGIAVFSREDSVDECIKRADEALYEGKHNGRNRIVSSA